MGLSFTDLTLNLSFLRFLFYVLGGNLGFKFAGGPSLANSFVSLFIKGGGVPNGAQLSFAQCDASGNATFPSGVLTNGTMDQELAFVQKFDDSGNPLPSGKSQRSVTYTIAVTDPSLTIFYTPQYKLTVWTSTTWRNLWIVIFALVAVVLIAKLVMWKMYGRKRNRRQATSFA